MAIDELVDEEIAKIYHFMLKQRSGRRVVR